MPYIVRDNTGKIVGLSATQSQPGQEYREASDGEVDTFLQQMSADHVKELLSTSDAEMVRVIEDLVSLLIQKSVICFTDLPLAVQHKLVDRDKARKQMNEILDESDHLI